MKSDQLEDKKVLRLSTWARGWGGDAECYLLNQFYFVMGVSIQ